MRQPFRANNGEKKAQVVDAESESEDLKDFVGSFPVISPAPSLSVSLLSLFSFPSFSLFVFLSFSPFCPPRVRAVKVLFGRPRGEEKDEGENRRKRGGEEVGKSRKISGFSLGEDVCWRSRDADEARDTHTPGVAHASATVG